MVDLNELVDAMGLQSDFLTFFVEKGSGEIATVTGEEIERIEAGQKGEELEMAREVLLSGRYVELPEVDKRELMEEFCFSLGEGELQESLLEVARQEGAFEYFGTTTYLYQKEEEWLSYIQEALEKKARAWCEENGVRFKVAPRKERPDWL